MHTVDFAKNILKNMNITHLSTYKFIVLTALPQLRDDLFKICSNLNLKGTILLSPEGMNLNISGLASEINELLQYLKTITYFKDLEFKTTYCNEMPYKRLKVKIKKEIITLRDVNVDATKARAKSISPIELKKWLDAKRNTVLLDTRNEYEIEYGSFVNAVNLQLKNFCQFPAAATQLDKQHEIVMFCTGGIRCEKAALFLAQLGFENVYQLEGGILNYFAQVGGAYYNGNCYVFDERVALNSHLEEVE